MQVPPEKRSFYQVEFFEEPEPISEDCLYLNVWTPATMSSQDLPVMVWIHGGGFSQGSGSMPTFDGISFAQKGVVLVTINYRLETFGLMAHPGLTNRSEHQSSGNYGLLDQGAALKWVQRTIHAFSGDPDNVAVFGPSSGAGNINKLMASQLTKGLFHRAILQSGSAYTFGRTQTLRQSEQHGKDAKTFLTLYPHQTDEEARDSFNKGWRDEMAWGAHTLARIHAAQNGSKDSLYYFCKAPPGGKSTRYGAFHSADIVYVFDGFKTVDRPWTTQDKKLAEKMLSYWVNFSS